MTKLQCLLCSGPTCRRLWLLHAKIRDADTKEAVSNKAPDENNCAGLLFAPMPNGQRFNKQGIRELTDMGNVPTKMRQDRQRICKSDVRTTDFLLACFTLLCRARGLRTLKRALLRLTRDLRAQQRA